MAIQVQHYGYLPRAISTMSRGAHLQLGQLMQQIFNNWKHRKELEYRYWHTLMTGK